MKRLVGVSLFCVMMAWPAARSVAAPAPADHASRPADSSESAGQDREKAKEYFRRAQILFNGGKYSLAVREFESAYALWKHPNIEFNLAVVYALLGSYVASVRFQNLLRQHAPDKLLQLPAEAKVAQQKVGTVVVSVQNPNAVIYVNGDEVGRRHVKVVVLVGRAVLEVRLGSRIVARKVVSVNPGQEAVYEFASLKVSKGRAGGNGALGNGSNGGAPSAGGTSTRSRSWQRLHWAYFASTLAVAVGLAAGATWSSIHSKKLYDDYMDDRSNAQLRSDGITSVRTSNILWGVAGGLGAAAVILAVFTRWRRHSERNAAAQVIPIVSPGGAGVSVSWRR
ncbi:MAG: hypothetical protein J7M25_15130 [Deltaproteobacteria bacterium]|nr:hypothetical protein [Deltaproteobacteria bacterium]